MEDENTAKAASPFDDASGKQLLDFLGKSAETLVPKVTGVSSLGSTAFRWLKLWVLTISANAIALAAGTNKKAGTVTLNGTTPVVVANTSFLAGSVVLFSLKTVGGTVGAIPHLATATPATGFTVVGTASDTSVYNYVIIDTE